ncbi:hypothetical protein N9955_01090 [bacterium]|nr:hypothetical protein [bacterium]
MAITVDWPTKIINIPRNDLILLQSVPTEIRELDLNTFRLTLTDLLDDSEGMPWVDTHNHIAPISVGGVTLARVVEIINGYTVTFEDGQYAVNLKGANTNLADVTNVNQVSVRSSNSAGLQDLSTLLAASYQGEVVVDVIDGQAGTDTPIGTRSTPVNNFTDAKAIADRLGIHRFKIARTCTIDTVDFGDGYKFIGDSAITVVVILDSSANVENCVFENITITGEFDGAAVVEKCNVLDVSNFAGILWQCSINGVVTISSNTQATIAECFSNIAGGDVGQTCTINMGVNGTLALREFNGGVNLTNFAGGGTSAVSMDFNSGRLIIESTVTGGKVYVRGSCDVTDNSTGTAQVFDQTLHRDLEDINFGVQQASKLIPYNRELT